MVVLLVMPQRALICCDGITVLAISLVVEFKTCHHSNDGEDQKTHQTTTEKSDAD
jgi:hypothetical protein